ncbi:MAG: NHLP leader peptide family RiPP precursor [Peptococcaceae bacterium]|nr:NHLP leader peptide family RiPP precursor [Peptococcaceae bacterium]
MENPKEILGRFGVQVPAEVEVKVVEELPGVVYLVLPVNPAEMTDKQLDGVGGGLDLPGGWCLCRGHWDTNCWVLGSGGN